MVRMASKMFKALVITPSEKTVEFGSLSAIARAETCKRENTETNPAIRALAFVAEVGFTRQFMKCPIYPLRIFNRSAYHSRGTDRI